MMSLATATPMSLPTNLNTWLSYLETLHPKAIDLGLERIRVVAERMHLLAPKSLLITVGGTNGKGSCVALLASIVQSAGYRVGVYTSPHLLHYNERITIAGERVRDKSLCAAFAEIEVKRGDISLTYFEFGTLAALWLFQQAQLDVIILEVGMGGRLDAVNVLAADLVIISTIALDHMQWLGSDRETIGYEKAGIMRAGRPVVCGDEDVPNSVLVYAQTIGANLAVLGKDYQYQSGAELQWQWQSVKQKWVDLPVPAIKLQNAATVLMGLELIADRLPVPFSAVVKGLEKVRVPGRFQLITSERVPIIIDVAHNPAAAQHLAQQLTAAPIAGKTHAVVAMLADKDLAGTCAPLVPLISTWHVAALPVPRASGGEQLAAALKSIGVLVSYRYDSVIAAYKTAIAHADSNDRIVVFGSFYTVAEILWLEL